jgi:hypothetical protein
VDTLGLIYAAFSLMMICDDASREAASPAPCWLIVLFS